MTAPVKSTQPELITWKFAGEDYDLLQVNPFCDQQEAIAMSITLSEGLEMLCGRAATSTNHNDDPATVSELRTLGVVASAINALQKTARSKLESEQGGAQ
ncbi:hypothetical protein PSCICJ_48150 [Pseudomonas cichorii]|uniref:hypothetical protein n=1 Tax=Pseudomonas cichorii TaxID=36746 RepID=UPI00190FEA3F|nr:hypothetical protein [Pseudomonas cichorii]GFM68697.1 hypothetical protein PSCICJ_48150 [Pseudomonas cichorii]